LRGVSCQSASPQIWDARGSEKGSNSLPFFVIAGLDPAIHAAVTIRRKNIARKQTRARMDTRVKPAYDKVPAP